MASRVLLLTFFYPPDLSAGAFRSHALVEAMRLQALGYAHIDVLTTQPNRYNSHAPTSKVLEECNGIRIRRIQLPAHKNGKLDQSRAFLVFALKAIRIARAERYDLVVATSSRLMTAILGTCISYQQKSKLYLDIRDLFVKNLRELFPPPISKPLRLFFGALERLAISRASGINLVSRGFQSYFQNRYPDRKFSFFSNGVDKDFVNFPTIHCLPKHDLATTHVLYAGNIGDGQALHLIIPHLAQKLGSKVNFLIIGAGGRLHTMHQLINDLQLTNVKIIPPVPRKELLSLYQSCDVLFLHLNDYKSFHRVLPSKLFEYAATGKPIWAGANGYAAEFINKEVHNAAVFQPCDADAAIQAFESLQLEHTPRPDFVERFSRNRIMKPMAGEVLSLIDPTK
ncbi:glycosyltransferase family 4 protein [Pseudomonas monteilii]|uniref:glycosyltransferase family 4 protein n=1 Tax=Pseudomonas TaxID=286 RepID=UPI0030D31CD3